MGCNNVLWGLVKSGQDCGPSTEVNSTSNSLSETTNNFVNSSISNDTTNVALVQNQTVNVTAGQYCCPAGINISQKASNNIKTKTNVDANFVNSITSQIGTTISQKMQQDSKNVTDLLNSSPGGHTIMNINTNLSRVLSNISRNENIMNKLNNVASAQGQIINLNCTPIQGMPAPSLPSNLAKDGAGQCIISQELISSLLSETIVKIAMKQIQEDAYFVRLDNDLKQSSSNQGRGLTDIVDTIGNTIKSVVSSASFIYIAIVAAIVLFIPLIIFAFKSGKKNVTVSTPSGYTASTSEGAIAQYLRSIKGKRRY